MREMRANPVTRWDAFIGVGALQALFVDLFWNGGTNIYTDMPVAQHDIASTNLCAFLPFHAVRVFADRNPPARPARIRRLVGGMVPAEVRTKSCKAEREGCVVT